MFGPLLFSLSVFLIPRVCFSLCLYGRLTTAYLPMIVSVCPPARLSASLTGWLCVWMVNVIADWLFGYTADGLNTSLPASLIPCICFLSLSSSYWFYFLSLQLLIFLFLSSTCLSFLPHFSLYLLPSISFFFPSLWCPSQIENTLSSQSDVVVCSLLYTTWVTDVVRE